MWAEMRDFKICQEDFHLKPPDGILKDLTFSWLGFVQYIHLTSGHFHASKAPRVILIHKQFVVGTATDLLRQPIGYKLGHVVFGEYERNEIDCNLSHHDINSGVRCPRASIEISIRNILPHPEFSRFGTGNSVVLVKLFQSIKSSHRGTTIGNSGKEIDLQYHASQTSPDLPTSVLKDYTIPACLPSRSERFKKRTNKIIYLIDYMSSVPRDLNSEKMGKKTLRLYTHRECKRHRKKMGLDNEGVTHALCSSGCGVRPGAPIVSQSTEGRFELMGLAIGSGPCSNKAMRHRLNPEPPVYIDLYPYSSWIINVITAHRIPKPYPETYELMKGGSRIGVKRTSTSPGRQRKGWKGRTYSVGDMCFESLNSQKKTSFFYSEQFHVQVGPPTRLRIDMMISAGVECRIVCARIILPNRSVKPKVKGIGSSNITVKINTEWFPSVFTFSMGLSGVNNTGEPPDNDNNSQDRNDDNNDNT